MKYDFTSYTDRRGHDAIALDGVGMMPGFTPDSPKAGFDFIPMWIADMNFPTVPAVVDAIVGRCQHPFFGYFFPPQEYIQAIIEWQRTRNGAKGLTPKCIGYENGVHGGNVSALRVFCSHGDKVLLHTPSYSAFLRNLKELGYDGVYSPLVRDENGIWRMDFEDMERKIAQQHIHTAIFCSPHNPTGRVWERWEIEKMMELYKKYDVYVISDEIWSDIVFSGHKHIPTQQVSEDAASRTIAMYAPSKTFNIAGLVGSYHVILDPYLQDRFAAESGSTHYNNMNILSVKALLGAYSSADWVGELCRVLEKNATYAYNYIKDNFEGVEAALPQGTYMLFLDCTQWCRAHGKTIDELQKAGWDVGVGWQDGRQFAGPCHVRMNLALPFSKIEEAFDRLNRYVFAD